jgi:hypothetical protein
VALDLRHILDERELDVRYLLPVEFCEQLLRRDGAVGIKNDLGDLHPVHGHIEAHSHPAPATDVGRHEVPVGVRSHQFLLVASRSRAPASQPIVVVVIGIHHERAAHEPGGLTMAEPFGNPRQAQADIP